jgi:hypothetical protein
MVLAGNKKYTALAAVSRAVWRFSGENISFINGFTGAS